MCARAPSHNFTRAAVRQPFTRKLTSAARTREYARLSMTVTGNAKHIHDGQNKGGRVATHTTGRQHGCVATNANKTQQ